MVGLQYYFSVIWDKKFYKIFLIWQFSYEFKPKNILIDFFLQNLEREKYLRDPNPVGQTSSNYNLNYYKSFVEGEYKNFIL